MEDVESLSDRMSIDLDSSIESLNITDPDLKGIDRAMTLAKLISPNPPSLVNLQNLAGTLTTVLKASGSMRYE